MKKRVRLTQNQKVDIIKAYLDLTPMAELARQYAVTRQGIYKIVKAAGIETSAAPMEVSCSACGTVFLRHRFRIRRQKHHFCGDDCYHAFLAAGNGRPYIGNRMGQYRAREIVSTHFALQAGHIVHHEDRNTLNNDLDNLRVFACQGDHVRRHRGFDVPVLWDGRY
jgi:hypothetical protein